MTTPRKYILYGLIIIGIIITGLGIACYFKTERTSHITFNIHNDRSLEEGYMVQALFSTSSTDNTNGTMNDYLKKNGWPKNTSTEICDERTRDLFPNCEIQFPNEEEYTAPSLGITTIGNSIMKRKIYDDAQFELQNVDETLFGYLLHYVIIYDGQTADFVNILINFDNHTIWWQGSY